MGDDAAAAAAAAVLRAPTGDLEGAGLLTGLFGNTSGSARSPYRHQREADAQGLRLIYRLYDFEAFGLEAADLERMRAAAAALGLPFSTYRRHLSQATTRIVAWLWDGEVYGAAPEHR